MTVEISFLISVIAIICTVVGLYHTFSKDTKASITNDNERMESIRESLLKANMKLDQVCATTNETRSDIKAMDKKIQEQDKRITIIERDLKTAFSLIDDIKDDNEN